VSSIFACLPGWRRDAENELDRFIQVEFRVRVLDSLRDRWYGKDSRGGAGAQPRIFWVAFYEQLSTQVKQAGDQPTVG
jgi:hypothetical protein